MDTNWRIANDIIYRDEAVIINLFHCFRSSFFFPSFIRIVFCRYSAVVFSNLWRVQCVHFMKQCGFSVRECEPLQNSKEFFFYWSVGCNSVNLRILNSIVCVCVCVWAREWITTEWYGRRLKKGYEWMAAIYRRKAFPLPTHLIWAVVYFPHRQNSNALLWNPLHSTMLIIIRHTTTTTTTAILTVAAAT